MLKLNGVEWNFPAKGMMWATLAGIAGAVGAFGILLAFGAKGTPAVVMAIVFAGAPIVNAVVARMAHPPAGGWGRSTGGFCWGSAWPRWGGVWSACTSRRRVEFDDVGRSPAGAPSVWAVAARASRRRKRTGIVTSATACWPAGPPVSGRVPLSAWTFERTGSMFEWTVVGPTAVQLPPKVATPGTPVRAHPRPPKEPLPDLNGVRIPHQALHRV